MRARCNEINVTFTGLNEYACFWDLDMMFLGSSMGCLASKGDFTRSNFSYSFYGIKRPPGEPKRTQQGPHKRGSSAGSRP